MDQDPKRLTSTASVLLKHLHCVETQQSQQFLEQLTQLDRPTTLGFLNQHGYNLASTDPGLRNCFLDMDYLLRDGIGIKIACKLYRLAPGHNMNGTDWIPQIIQKILQQHDGQVQCFCYGTKEPWLSRGVLQLFGQVRVYQLDGFQSLAQYLAHYQQHAEPERFQLIVLAMGMPKQEQLAYQLKQQAQGRVLIICGGAIIDFMAKRFPRAPKWMRQNGLEWLYRLWREPGRLFQRYVIGIPLFFWRLLK